MDGNGCYKDLEYNKMGGGYHISYTSKRIKSNACCSVQKDLLKYGQDSG